MWSTWSLKQRMLTAFVGLALLMLVVGGLNYWSLQSVITSYDQISDVNLPSAQALGRMRYRTQDIARTILRITVDASLDKFDGIPKQKARFEESVRILDAEDANYAALPFGPGEEEMYKDFKAKWAVYHAAAKRALELATSKDPAEKADFQKIVLEGLPAMREAFDTQLEKIVQYQDTRAKEFQKEAKKAAAFANLLGGSLVGGGFFAALLIGWIFSSSLANALRRIGEEIGHAAEFTSAGSTQLSASSQQLSSGATQAASSLEETVASLEELSSMVNRNANHAAEANSLSVRSRETAEQGEKEIARLIQSMSEIAQGSKKIEEIINVIDDIAFQTNLLALNAAVEAARAGEQGKGFAVVAEAVRALAQRSSSAAKDINSLIKENVDKSERGSKVADASALVLREIVQGVLKVSDLNGEIASASREQSQGISQISGAMNQLDQATQNNAASSEEVAASAEEMSSQARSLNQLVGELNQIVQGRGAAVHVASRPNSRVTSAPAHKPSAPIPFVKKQKPLPAQHAIPFDGEEGESSVGTAEGF